MFPFSAYKNQQDESNYASVKSVLMISLIVRILGRCTSSMLCLVERSDCCCHCSSTAYRLKVTTLALSIGDAKLQGLLIPIVNVT